MTKTSRKSPLRAAVLVGIAVLGASALLVAAGCGDDGENLPAGVVARVGDAPITEAQLDKTIEQSRAEAVASGQSLPKEGEEGYDDIRRQALQSLVQQKVVDFEAADCGKPCAVTRRRHHGRAQPDQAEQLRELPEEVRRLPEGAEDLEGRRQRRS